MKAAVIGGAMPPIFHPPTLPSPALTGGAFLSVLAVPQPRLCRLEMGFTMLFASVVGNEQGRCSPDHERYVYFVNAHLATPVVQKKPSEMVWFPL